MEISFGVDPASLAVSTAALWIAFREMRRNRSPHLRVLKFSESGGMDVRVNNGQLFNQFSVIVRNEGIALHNLTARLCFRNSHGGTSSIALSRSRFEDGEFASGMVGEFYLRSFELNSQDIAFICDLEETRKQEAHIAFYSQGYLAWVLRLDSLYERNAIRLNHVIWRINQWMPTSTVTTRSGKKLLRTWHLPALLCKSWKLDNFLRELRGEQQKRAGTTTADPS